MNPSTLLTGLGPIPLNLWKLRRLGGGDILRLLLAYCDFASSYEQKKAAQKTTRPWAKRVVHLF
jgi:hypothetical protein